MNAKGTGAVEKIAATKGNGTMADFLMAKARSFQQLLPRGMDPDRFIRMAMKAIISNPKLATCDKASMVIALGTAAELGLDPNGALGYGAIVPFNNRKSGKLEAKFMIGYKGLLALMYRTEIFQTITAHEVCENDLFEYEYGLNAHLKHVPAMRERGAVTTFYAYYKTKDGGFDFQVASKEELLAWGQQYSRNFDQSDSPWQTAEDEMCKKTLLRKLSKYGPIRVDIPGEDPENDRPEDLGRFDALLAEANAPAALLPAPETQKVSPPKAEPPKQEQPQAPEPSAQPLDAASQAAAEKGFELGAQPEKAEPPQPEPQKTADGPKVPPATGKKTVAEMFQHQGTPATKRTVDPETGELVQAEPKAEALELY